jgi:hypothetical protein
MLNQGLTIEILNNRGYILKGYYGKVVVVAQEKPHFIPTLQIEQNANPQNQTAQQQLRQFFYHMAKCQIW